MTRHYSKEDTQKANLHMQTCSSTSLATREMQIKTTMRYFTLTMMAVIKNVVYTKYWQGGGETGILIQYWLEHKMMQPL